MGNHGPGPVDGEDDDTIVEEGVSGELVSTAVFVVVRVVTAGELASTLSILELSGVGEVGEASQLIDPLPSVDSDWEGA